jgi:hypothetical protein
MGHGGSATAAYSTVQYGRSIPSMLDAMQGTGVKRSGRKACEMERKKEKG